MDAVHVCDGESIDIVAESEIQAGDVVVIGKLVTVALAGIDAGARGSVRRRGGFAMAKKREAGSALAQGTEVWWSPTDRVVHAGEAAEGDLYAGKTGAPATDDDERVLILLDS